MSWLSKVIDKVLPGAPAANFTENTFDKIISPESKDMVEAIGGTLGGMYLGLPGMLGNFAGGATGSAIVGDMFSGAAMSMLGGGDPVTGMVTAGVGSFFGGLGGNAGKFFNETPVGNALKSALIASGGDVGAVGGILGSLGFNAQQKDMAEYFLTLAALTGLGNKMAKETLNKAKEIESMQFNTLTEMIGKAKELYPTDINEEALYQKESERITKSYANLSEEFFRGLSTRNMNIDSMAGQLAKLGHQETSEKLQLARDIALSKNDRTIEAMNAILQPLNMLGNLGKDYRASADALAKLPFDAYNSYMAMQAAKSDPERQYYEQMLKQQYPEYGQMLAEQDEATTGGYFTPEQQTAAEQAYGPPAPTYSMPQSELNYTPVLPSGTTAQQFGAFPPVQVPQATQQQPTFNYSYGGKDNMAGVAQPSNPFTLPNFFAPSTGKVGGGLQQPTQTDTKRKNDLLFPALTF